MKINLLLILTIRLFLCPSIVLAQIQIGSDIEGAVPQDRSGRDVAISDQGNTIAIGSTFNDVNGTESGHVRVFHWDGSEWVQLGEDITGDAAGDHFGNSLVLSANGDRLAVAALDHAGFAGLVRVFDWVDPQWVQIGEDLIGAEASDLLGTSLSMSDDGLIVAIGAKDGNTIDPGYVIVYDWNGSDWEVLGDVIQGDDANDQCGTSVSLNADGTYLAIGSPGNDVMANEAGMVKVYAFDSGSWVQVGGEMYGVEVYDSFGFCVSLNAAGDILAVGTPASNGNGSNSGLTQVFSWSGSDWTQLGGDIFGEAAGDFSAYRISLSSSGQTLAIGARANDGNGNLAGHVRVFHWNGMAWMQVGNDMDGEYAGDEFGFTLSMTGDGSRVAIGSEFNDDAGTNTGHVKVFELPVFPDAILENSFAGELSVYPNPSNGEISVTFDKTYDKLTYVLNNVLGQWMTSETIYITDRLDLSVDGLPGFYFLHISDGLGHSAVIKLLKE